MLLRSPDSCGGQLLRRAVVAFAVGERLFSRQSVWRLMRLSVSKSGAL